MPLSIGIGIGIANRVRGPSLSEILAAGYNDVVARDYTDNSLVIRDTVTPTNNYNGPLITGGVFTKGTFTRASTATFVGSDGLIQTALTNIPRIHYDPVTLACLGLLNEGARTNLCLQSETFDNATWVKSVGTLTADQATAPDGELTADKWDEGVANDMHGLVQAITTAASTTYTASVYAKYGDRQYLTVGLAVQSNSAIWASAIFDLINGTVTGTNQATAVLTASSITPMGNGWYRCTVTGHINALTDMQVVIANASAATGAAFRGAQTYTGTSKFTYLWGAQLEAGGAASSYIPTTTAAVTRAADVGPALASTVFNLSQTEGSLYFAGVTSRHGANQVLAQIDDGTENERIRIVQDSSNVIRCIVTDGGVEQCNLNMGTVANDTEFKIALSWTLNDFAASLNGAAVVTDVGGTMPTVTTLRIGQSFTGEQWLSTIKEDMHIATAVSDAALQALAA